MNIRRLTEEDYHVSTWSGGETRELVLSPASGDYNNRQFDYRLSSATVELNESNFSDLTGFNRDIMILEGNVTLFHDEPTGQRVVELGPLEQDSFQGKNPTKSIGTCVDFNLMYQEGYEGSLEVLTQVLEQQLEPNQDYLFYSLEDFIDVSVCQHGENSSYKLTKGDSLYLSELSEPVTLTLAPNMTSIHKPLAIKASIRLKN